MPEKMSAEQHFTDVIKADVRFNLGMEEKECGKLKAGNELAQND